MSMGWSAFNALSSRLWFRLGLWLERHEQISLSRACLRNAVSGTGATAGAAGFLLAKQLLAASRNKDAVAVCEQALIADPSNAQLWCALGAARRYLAEMPSARAAYEKALELRPAYAQAWNNLGEWHLAKGDAAGALGKIERALSLDRQLMEALNNHAVALYELSRFEDSERAARAAIEIFPNEAALHVNLGNVLLHTGRARPAVKSFRRALECDPNCSEAHLNLATLFGEKQHLSAALSHIEHEIAVKGESVQRLVSLALAHHANGDLAKAEVTSLRVLEMQPGSVSALITLSCCFSSRADHRRAIELHQRALLTNPNMPEIFSNIAFDATYLPELSPEDVFAYHREWSKRFEAPVRERQYVHRPQPETLRPLRIGYVSGDLSMHPVGFLLNDVASNHDRSKFHVHFYSMMRGADEITQAIKATAASWIDALLMSADELAEAIRQDNIDILIDLSGHTAYNRLPVFALKPAPVQVTWIGYFHSTGLDSIDYFITDPWTSPRGSAQLFSETPVWMPHSRFCYSPPSSAPEVAAAPVLASGAVTFGSFNRVDKLVPPVIAAWAEIVRAVPGSRLLLKAGSLTTEAARDDLLNQFTVHGIGAERLVLRGPSSHQELLQQYAEMDIALDPFPFSGGMTTLEALWMGVPVVTLSGNTVVSRQSTSVLCNLNLGELVFADSAAYIAGAIALARDENRLVALRKGMRQRMAASPLRDAKEFTRDLEALYHRMWQAHCRGERLPSAIA